MVLSLTKNPTIKHVLGQQGTWIMGCILDNMESVVIVSGWLWYCDYVGEYPCFCEWYKRDYSGVMYHNLCNLLSKGSVRKYINIYKYIDKHREGKIFVGPFGTGKCGHPVNLYEMFIGVH